MGVQYASGVYTGANGTAYLVKERKTAGLGKVNGVAGDAAEGIPAKAREKSYGEGPSNISKNQPGDRGTH